MCGNGLDMRQRSAESLLAEAKRQWPAAAPREVQLVAAAARWEHYTARNDPASRHLADDERLLQALLGTVRRLEQRLTVLEARATRR